MAYDGIWNLESTLQGGSDFACCLAVVRIAGGGLLLGFSCWSLVVRILLWNMCEVLGSSYKWSRVWGAMDICGVEPRHDPSASVRPSRELLRTVDG